MNPNSANQTWSLWTFRVSPGRPIPRTVNEVKTNVARFGRKVFGTAGQGCVEADTAAQEWICKFRVEGHPAQERGYRAHILKLFTAFFVNGFGAKTTVRMEAKLEAGEPESGGARSQLLILPGDLNGQRTL